MIWTPHVTVAAVVEENGRFLLVEEAAEGRRVFNQPAGHWEEGESLAEAAVRETLEETGYAFTPEAVLGIYHWRHPRRDITFLRVAFVGSIGGYDPDRPLDQGIIGPRWLSRAELLGRIDRLRSPQVLRCVDDYLAGRRYPLEMLVQV
ncbi:MAG: NUDIX hydrolase [Pseudomonadota bacterium]